MSMFHANSYNYFLHKQTSLSIMQLILPYLFSCLILAE